VLEALRDDFNEENPHEPFVGLNMEPLDSDFKDLIRGLINFDPVKKTYNGRNLLT